MASSVAPVMPSNVSGDADEGPKISFVVGPTQEIFSIAVDLVRKVCKFLDNRPGNTELGYDPIVLKDVDTHIFHIFYLWSSCRDLVLLEYMIMVVGGTPRRIMYDKMFMQLVQCYCLGLTLDSAEFQNAVMDFIVRTAVTVHFEQGGMRLGMETDQIIAVYENTVAGSPLRQFVLDSQTTCTDIEKWIEDCDISDSNSLENFTELTVMLATVVDGEFISQEKLLPWVKDPCSYHVHPHAAAGYSCSRARVGQ
ncbi:hypothetical protein PVAG01_02119 [Phlyctema vagabunda]|uniref:Uncharacterized protein n=1 Tax=Phlyctema vagabunda TaxID=108571 RepID=A0ABR4PPN4_9HELO